MNEDRQPWPVNEQQPVEAAQTTMSDNQPAAKLDLQALAQRIYTLLREELRITRERAG
jgi:hypothetical protein